MDFWQSMSLLGRRWGFFGLAFVLAVGITAGIYHEVKAQYQATTQLLLEPPNIDLSGMNGKSISPWDAYGDLNTVAALVSYGQSSQQALNRLKGEGVYSPYTVSPDPTGDVPELIITVTAYSPASAIAQDDILAQDTIAYVYDQQLASHTNPDTFVHTAYLSRPVNAPKDDKSRIRVAVAAGVVLVFLAVALTFLYDSFLRRRARTEPEVEVSHLRPADGFDHARGDVPAAANGHSTRPAKGLGPAPGRGSSPAHLAQDR